MDNTLTNKKRIEEIDILKGLGIILMVAGHSSAPFRLYIYLFHMAIFFMASGFFFKEKNSYSIISVWHSVFGKFKQLWLPFFIWNTIYVLFHNLFLKTNIYTDNADIFNYVVRDYARIATNYSIHDILIYILKGAIFSTNEQLLTAGWFLKILFMINALYLLINYICIKIEKRYTLVIQAFVSLLLLLFGYYCSVNSLSLKGIEHMSSFYCLYFLGNLLGIYKDKYSDWNWRYQLPLMLISFSMLFVLNKHGFIELASNLYVNPFFLLSSSFWGWILLYSSSYFINHVPSVKAIVQIIGKHTLAVVLIHLLCLKPVALIVDLYYDVPKYCIAALPNLYGDRGLWWLLYTCIGVAIPVTLDCLYDSLKSRLKKSEFPNNNG